MMMIHYSEEGRRRRKKLWRGGNYFSFFVEIEEVLFFPRKRNSL